MLRHTTLLTCLVFAQSSLSQIWEREEIAFDSIQSRARDLANRPYEAPSRDLLPAWMADLSYDQYRDIRFNPNQALWAMDNLPFRAMFFHPGYLYREPVMLNEFTASHQQRIRLADAYFNYGPLVPNHGEMPPDGGFAGFRLHHQLNQPNVFDELIVFQGASYWRALGRNQRFGISARGLAINTGCENTPEEFPAFREFWLRKPEPDDTEARIYALLDSPSYVGAYAFRVLPSNETIVHVHAVLFARTEVKRLGIAPMSSMFWFGENSRRRFDDFRPEVHDSDGLAIRMGSGERIWRPICNDSGKLEFSFFDMSKCDGFGLLQRDRRFSAYEDAEAAYHQRPSVWIEPSSDWGPGRVMLMEIPATNELTDNTVALWEPANTVKAGERIDFKYRQIWTKDQDPSKAVGYVVATRTGIHDWEADRRSMFVEFAGPALNQPSDIPLTAHVEVVGDAAARVKLQNVIVQGMPEERWRASFQILSAVEGVKLSEIGPVELRCCLKRGENYLTETWVHRVTP